MPAYLHMIRIDWHVANTPQALHPALIAANAQLDSTDHTLDTFGEQLRAVAAAEPALIADALVEDGYNAYVLLRARGGSVTITPVVERPAGAARTGDLPYDELATVILVRDHDAIAALLAEVDDELDAHGPELQLPTTYADEGQLRALVERVAAAIDAGGGAFVAEVELDRYVVDLAPGHASVRKLVIATEPELCARLLRADYPTVPQAPRVADQKYAMPLYWPEDMLRFMQDEAMRTDRSLSWVAQLAFKQTRARLAGADRSEIRAAMTGAQLAGGNKRKQTLYFPGAMLDELEAQAARLDSSVSFVAQAAVALAKGAIEATPTVESSTVE